MNIWIFCTLHSSYPDFKLSVGSSGTVCAHDIRAHFTVPAALRAMAAACAAVSKSGKPREPKSSRDSKIGVRCYSKVSPGVIMLMNP